MNRVISRSVRVFRSHRRASAARAMGTDICTKHLQNISQHLAEFEKKPKEIDGNLIYEWFNVGEDLFQEFYSLGTSLKWNSTALRRTQSKLDDIVRRVTENRSWLQSFISMYPALRIDMEGASPAARVCRVRSGLQLLLHGFTGISKPFDNVLNDLQQNGDLDEFDEHLRVWVEDGHRPDFFPGDQHPDTPKSHWWWF